MPLTVKGHIVPNWKAIDQVCLFVCLLGTKGFSVTPADPLRLNSGGREPRRFTSLDPSGISPLGVLNLGKATITSIQIPSLLGLTLHQKSDA